MSLDDATSKLIANIYAGAYDSDAFDTAIDRLIDFTDARLILVSCVDLRCIAYDYARFYSADNGRLLDGIADYQAEHYRNDPTLRHAVRHPHDGIVTLRQTLTNSAADIEFNRWVESELGTTDMHIRYTPPDDDLILGMSIHARLADGALTEKAKRLLALVFPHLENARRLIARPPDLSSETEARLIIDQACRILSISPAADSLLATLDGLMIRDRSLRGIRRTDDRRIDALIRAAAGGMTTGMAGGTIAVPRPSGKRAWIVRATSLPMACGPFASFGAAAQLTIIDPEAGPSTQAAARWRDLFGLTPAESRLTAALLADDPSLRTVADRLGIAYATARVQLSSVFDKVGVRSQVQLARLLTRIGGWVVTLWYGFDQTASAWV